MSEFVSNRIAPGDKVRIDSIPEAGFEVYSGATGTVMRPISIWLPDAWLVRLDEAIGDVHTVGVRDEWVTVIAPHADREALASSMAEVARWVRGKAIIARIMGEKDSK